MVPTGVTGMGDRIGFGNLGEVVTCHSPRGAGQAGARDQGGRVKVFALSGKNGCIRAKSPL